MVANYLDSRWRTPPDASPASPVIDGAAASVGLVEEVFEAEG